MAESCDKRRLLSEIVTRTVASAYTAKQVRDLAAKEHKDLAPYNFAPRRGAEMRTPCRWGASPAQESARVRVVKRAVRIGKRC
jgi:hypothetical protein